MPKGWIDEKEWYPVFEFSPSDEGSSELSESDLADYLETVERFEKWQQRLRQLKTGKR